MEQEKEDWMAAFNRKHNCHLNEKKNKKKIQKKNKKYQMTMTDLLLQIMTKDKSSSMNIQAIKDRPWQIHQLQKELLVYQ